MCPSCKCSFDLFCSEFVWRELLLAAVGEQFSDSLQTGDDISGVTASIRQYVVYTLSSSRRWLINIYCRNYDIIQIWNTRAEGDVDKIRDKVVALLPNVTFLATFYKGKSTLHATAGN